MAPRKQEIVPSIGVNVPAHIDLCRRILLGVRSSCDIHGVPMHLISDTGLLFSPNRRLPPLNGIIAHICREEEFASARKYHPNAIGTSNRSQCRGYPRVINDDHAIGRMGARYLLSLGLRKLVVLDKSTMAYSQGRRDGFLAFAAEAGAEVMCLEFKRSSQLADLVPDLLDLAPPIGVMAESDYTARLLIECIPEFRKRVPHQIAVLGVDDDSMQNALSPISLSSVRTGGHEIGSRAAQWVLKMSAGVRFLNDPERVLPIRVVERASTNVLAVGDPLVSRAIRLLRDNVGGFRDVNDLVHSLGVNRRTLEIRFRKTLNRTIAHELTEARLRNARHLLESTNLTISEIAELVGYPEYRLLTLAFQRLTGEPPTAYRKRVRGD